MYGVLARYKPTGQAATFGLCFGYFLDVDAIYIKTNDMAFVRTHQDI